MKTGEILAIIGVVAIGGLVICFKCFGAKKQHVRSNIGESAKNVGKSNKENDVDISIINKYNYSEENLCDVVDELKYKQSEVQEDIVYRHNAAAKIIKESMDNILSDTENEVSAENSEQLDEIDDTLDKLLEE